MRRDIVHRAVILVRYARDVGKGVWWKIVGFKKGRSRIGERGFIIRVNTFLLGDEKQFLGIGLPT